MVENEGFVRGSGRLHVTAGVRRRHQACHLAPGVETKATYRSAQHVGEEKKAWCEGEKIQTGGVTVSPPPTWTPWVIFEGDRRHSPGSCVVSPEQGRLVDGRQCVWALTVAGALLQTSEHKNTSAVFLLATFSWPCDWWKLSSPARD